MRDSTYLGLALVAFVAGCLVHFAGWQLLLADQLASPDPLRRRSALVRWAQFAAAWQLLVLIAGGAWWALLRTHHGHGQLWAAPLVGLLIGTALPLQLVVLGIARAGRR